MDINVIAMVLELYNIKRKPKYVHRKFYCHPLNDQYLPKNLYILKKLGPKFMADSKSQQTLFL